VAKYIAHIQDGAYPMKQGQWIEGKRIDAINRAILKTGKAWNKLELPRAIKPGHYFSAEFNGTQIRIYKESNQC